MGPRRLPRDVRRSRCAPGPRRSQPARPAAQTDLDLQSVDRREGGAPVGLDPFQQGLALRSQADCGFPGVLHGLPPQQAIGHRQSHALADRPLREVGLLGDVRHGLGARRDHTQDRGETRPVAQGLGAVVFFAPPGPPARSRDEAARQGRLRALSTCDQHCINARAVP